MIKFPASTLRAMGLAGGLALIVVSCGSSPAVRWYGLESAGGELAPSQETTRFLGVGPFEFPAHLSRSQMVMRGAGAELRVDDYNRWIEPPDEAALRVIAANIDPLVPGITAVAFPYPNLLPVDYRLLGRVDRFESAGDGRVELVVQWGVSDPEGGILIRPRRSRHVSRITDPTDPAQIADAMSGLLADLSGEIAEELEQMLNAGIDG